MLPPATRGSVIDFLDDAVLVVDAEGRIRDSNPAARALLGQPEAEASALSVDLASACRGLDRLLRDPGFERGTFSDHDPSNGRRDYDVLISSFACDTAKDRLRVAVIRDITGCSEDQLRRDRYVDGVTGLANGRRFAERLEESMRAARAEGRLAALLHVDLDRLKDINEGLGHTVGDEILRAVAGRLRHRLREGDAVERMEKRECGVDVSRVGEDAFAILLSRIASVEDAEAVATRILAGIAEPIAAKGHRLTTTGSMGIAVFPRDAKSGEKLRQCADAALRRAQALGGGSYQFFQPALDGEMKRQLAMELRLRQALEDESLTVNYQPQVSLVSDQVVGAEALVRWDDDELGSVPPCEFIPLAERVGLIAALGGFVIESVCRQIASWQEDGYEPVPVAVNVSSEQLRATDLSAVIAQSLERHDVEARWLQLEITESVALGDTGQTRAVLHRLRRMGVRVALDDFGTGYSALSYLSMFPLDVIKLDRNFVTHLEPQAPVACVARGVIAIAHGLGLEVVAEGVEEPAQVQALREMGCDEIQGFVVSPALPASEFQCYLRRPGLSRAGGSRAAL